MPDRNRGLRDRIPVGSGSHGAGSRGSSDASVVRQAIRERQKNDATDAETICEALTRPTIRFVPAKSEEQQSVLMLHRVRQLLMPQRRMLVNAVRGHLGSIDKFLNREIAFGGFPFSLFVCR